MSIRPRSEKDGPYFFIPLSRFIAQSDVSYVPLPLHHSTNYSLLRISVFYAPMWLKNVFQHLYPRLSTSVFTEPTLFSAVFTKIVINNSAYEILYPGLLQIFR